MENEQPDDLTHSLPVPPFAVRDEAHLEALLLEGLNSPARPFTSSTVEQMQQKISTCHATTIIDRLKAKAQNVQGKHSAIELAEAEKRLGFPLPDLLRQVYMEVGYGWPLLSTVPFGLLSVWKASDEYRKARADAERGMPPYPEKLLPICEWGCGIESAIDCSHAEGPIIRIDPNFDVPIVLEVFDLSSDFKFYNQFANDKIASWYEANSLHEWLEAWLNGVNLFHLPTKMNPKRIDLYCPPDWKRNE